MRIDHEKKQIACSVGDLVYGAEYRRIGSDRGETFRRMWLGQDAHRNRAESRAAEDPNYRPEVGVSMQFLCGDWSVEVAGRIDGLSVDKQKKRIHIEEVKSLHFDFELAGLYRSEKLQRHLFQLMLYAYFLSKKAEYAEFDFFPQLVLVDIASTGIRTIDAPFDVDEIRSAFEGGVARLVHEVEAETALFLAKKAFAERIDFPHASMRPFQKEMVEGIGHAVSHREAILVSAPTGIGKTAGAIYPALIEALKRGKKLFFLTSKTMQQDMAVRVLSAINDGSFRVLRIRAKQKMCANVETICHEDFCPWAARYGEKMEKKQIRQRIVTDFTYFDPEQIFDFAKSEEVCPFEVSLELVEEADVVVCDYNYIFDPYVGLKTYQEESDYSDCILIIDEAHNLLDRARGYYSPEIRERELEAVANHLSMRPGAPTEGWESLMTDLRDHLRLLAEEAELDDRTRQALCEPRINLFEAQRVDWERIVTRYIAWKVDNRIAEEDDPIVDFYFKLVKFVNLLREEGEEFAHIIEQTDERLKLKIYCKDPSRFLAPILDSAHSVIAMSATLEPFDFYRKTLGFPDKKTSELSLPSPFPRDNRRILVVPSVDTTYKEREQHYDRIGELITEMSDHVEGNFLVLFPSYAFLQRVATKMPMSTKNVLIQRPDMTDYERNSYLRMLREEGGSGTLVLAVSGGMYAEGIDYQGKMLSGVFVVGPALPSVSFEQELLKRYYDEQYGAGFDYAYLIPGMTRVIQSAGRVIRSESDTGVIALLCKRFTNRSYTRYFPADWYQDSPNELVSKHPAAEVRAFFAEKQSGQISIFDGLREVPSPLPAARKPRRRSKRIEE